jgi:outer membrane protein TolC
MNKSEWKKKRAIQFEIGALLALMLSGPMAVSQVKSVQEIANQVEINIPASSIDRAEKDGTAYHVALKDLTRLALQNNLDIAISDTNEELYQSKVFQAHGAYDPTLSLTLGSRSTTQPNTNLTNQSNQGNSNNTRLDTWNFQFNQNVSTGGLITANFNSNRSDTNQQFALFSPQYNSSTSFQFTQPLLRNFRIDQTRSAIKLANLDVKINDCQFRQSVSTTVAAIQGVYWDLVYAIRNYEIQRESVKLAQVTVEQNREKVRIGTMSPLDVTVAQAAAASRMVDLVTAQQAINIAENNLRSTVSKDRKSDIWGKTIVPTDSSEFAEYKADLESSIDIALKNRPELQQYDLQMQQNSISYTLDRNLKKWQLDAVGSFGTVGVAGPQSFLNGKPIIDTSMVGGIGTAYTSLFTQGFKNWFVGFNIQIPLRNRSLDAQLAELKIQNKQLVMNRKNQEQKIAVLVRNAVDDLESNGLKVGAAKVARQMSEVQLDAETKRFKVGMSQNFLILQRQTELSTAQGAELQALVAYKKSIITLQQNMDTLLESNDFEIAGGSSAHWSCRTTSDK